MYASVKLLCRIPETNIILYIKYISIKKNKYNGQRQSFSINEVGTTGHPNGETSHLSQSPLKSFPRSISKDFCLQLTEHLNLEGSLGNVVSWLGILPYSTLLVFFYKLEGQNEYQVGNQQNLFLSLIRNPRNCTLNQFFYPIQVWLIFSPFGN